MIVKLKMHPAGKTLGKTCNYKLLQINFQINFFFLICGLQSKERHKGNLNFTLNLFSKIRVYIKTR